MKNGLFVTNSGIKIWWQNDKYHRLDGPAVEWEDGIEEWFINGIETPELEYWLKEHGLYGIPYSEWDDTMKMAAKLMWE